MICPECGSEQVNVIDSRPYPEYTRRRRECLDCGNRFSTIEVDTGVWKQLVKYTREVGKQHQKMIKVMDSLPNLNEYK